MRPWSIVIAVVAGLGVVFLIAYGSDGREYSGRDREGLEEQSAQQLVGLPVALGPEEAVAIVRQKDWLPSETATILDEVQSLVASTEGQPPDQARSALERAVDQLDVALDQIDDEISDTSNDRTKIRLIAAHNALERVRDVLEVRREHLA